MEGKGKKAKNTGNPVSREHWQPHQSGGYRQPCQAGNTGIPTEVGDTGNLARDKEN